MSDRIKIAVLLSGQLRDWKISSKIFKLWNEVNREISYDFFLSTWDDSYRGVKSKDSDLSMCVASQVILYEDSNTTEVIKYSYLLKRNNILKNRYEKEHGIKYNAVIATRPDIFIGPSILQKIESNIKNKYLGHRTLFINNGITEKLVKSKEEGDKHKFFMNDFYVYGHSMAVNIFSKMYDDIIDGRLENRIHVTPATHIVNNRINNRSSDGFVRPIRYTNVKLLEDMHNSGALKDMYTTLIQPEEFKVKYLVGLEQYVREIE